MGRRLLGLALCAFVGALRPGELRAAELCPEPKVAADIVRCAVEKSPGALRSRLTVDRARASESAAGRLANPTFSVQSGFLTFTGENRGDHQLSLTQPIDWGGERGARQRTAEGSRRVAEADARRDRAQLAMTTLAKLHRLRQAEDEGRLVAEAAETFGKLIALHQARPSLTPDQQVSLAVFRMAKGDLELRNSALADERRALDSYFLVTTGLSPEQVRRALPPRPTAWPPLPPKAPAAEAFRSERARAELAVAEAHADAVSAASWPALSVGPFLLAQRDNGVSRNLYGIMLNVELPVLSLNAAGRAAASKGVLLAEKELELTRLEETAERAVLSQRYTEAVKALGDSLPLAAMEQEHERMEKLFLRGVIPGTLTIESHRQFLELVRTRNERELKALETWWQLEAMAGRTPE